MYKRRIILVYFFTKKRGFLGIFSGQQLYKKAKAFTFPSLHLTLPVKQKGQMDNAQIGDVALKRVLF